MLATMDDWGAMDARMSDGEEMGGDELSGFEGGERGRREIPQTAVWDWRQSQRKKVWWAVDRGQGDRRWF